MAYINNNMKYIVMSNCTVHTVRLCVCVSAAGLQQHAVFLQQNAVVFFFLLQLWKVSHYCCIDTPVEGPGGESGEPAVWLHYLTCRAPYQSNCPPLRLTSHLTCLMLDP